MARQNKYGSYRGRRKYAKMIATLVLVGIIVVSVSYLIWGDHTLSLSIFPHFNHEEDTVQAEEPPEVELIIDDPMPATPEVAPQESGLLLGTDITLWMEQDLSEFDQLVVTVKDTSGKIYLPISLSDALSFSDYTAENALALETVMALEGKTSAWMSVLQDAPYGTYYVTASALMSERGFGYKDEDSTVWLDPGKEDTVAYVTALVANWIDMGFDEIILSQFHYPLTGDLDTIRYSADDPDQALEALLASIYAMTQEAGVELGMVMASGALVSGSVPYENWTAYVDTFYAMENDLPTAQSLVGESHLVTLAEQVPVSGDYLLTP